jgi:hypothetical protein
MNGCRLLWNLANNITNNQVAIVVVNAAMRQHPNHAGIQEYGSAALQGPGEWTAS